MAEYQNAYESIRLAGAECAAISVDSPARSEAVRRELSLPFPLLCDSRRGLLRTWNLLNEAEKGGIAFPAVFVIDRDRRVRFAAKETTASRVPPQALADFVLSSLTPSHSEAARPVLIFPRLRHFLLATRNIIHRGLRTPEP